MQQEHGITRQGHEEKPVPKDESEIRPSAWAPSYILRNLTLQAVSSLSSIESFPAFLDPEYKHAFISAILKHFLGGVSTCT